MGNGLQTREKIVLPTMDELYNDTAIVLKQNKLNMLLNTPPKNDWLKYHPTIKVKDIAGNSVPLSYLPIERVEYLLTVIFTKWWVEILDRCQIANSIVVTVRLWVIDPLTGEKMFNDGIGACPLQTDKDAGAIEWNKIKSGAVQMGAPAAESYAVKDAAEKYGRLFGKDLNRKDEISMIETLDSKVKAMEIKNDLPEEIKEIISFADQEGLNKIFDNNKQYQSNPEFMQLINARKKQL